MTLRAAVTSLVANALPGEIRLRIADRKLRRMPTLSASATNLRAASEMNLDSILGSAVTQSAWQAALPRLSEFAVPDGSGGVNPGDRRAIFFLVSALAPSSVLEIGTHIGASTIHIAEALRTPAGTSVKPGRMVTVDVLDVNDEKQRPWMRYGSELSPSRMINRLGLSEVVQFVANDSLAFMDSCEARFDLIFLDGSHEAHVVYQEVPRALALLNPDGVILLHDYFPDLKPLWSNGSVIAGPVRAIDRLQKEGLAVGVLPLGELPWETKLGSNRTSLAILTRRS